MKRKNLNKLLASGLMVTTLLVGCSSGTKSDASSGDDVSNEVVESSEITKEEVTIKFSWWGADNRHEAMKEVAKLYEKANPNVTVDIEYGAWDGWQTKILTQLSGKTEADVMQVNYNWLFSYGRGKNVFYNLDEVKNFIDLSNWDENYLKAMQVSGEQAAVPHGMTGRVNLMNSKLFTENDLELPVTYTDLIEAGKVISKDNTATGAENKYAFTNMGEVSKDLFIAQMLFNKTGKVMQTDGKVNYSVEEVEEVLSQYKAFEDAGVMPTFAQDPSIENESNPEWVNGRTGGIYEWANSLGKWVSSYQSGQASDDLTVGAYFNETANEKPNVYVKPNFGYAVSRNSKNPEVAADFINFMFTNEEAVKAAGDTLGVSSNKVTYDFQEKLALIDGSVKQGYEVLAEYDQTVMDPYFEDENVRNERYTAIEAFRSGKSTAAEAAKDYVEKQQNALDKYYKD